MRINWKRLRGDTRNYVSELNQKELLHILKRLDHIYYVDDEQKVTDKVYDHLKDTFEERYPKHAYLKKVAATRQKDDVKLPYPMGSLSKVKPNTQAFDKFYESHAGSWCLSDKLDGISLEVIYEGGKPVQAFTRGEDGIYGKDVTRHIPNLKIPKRISYKKHLAIRGEAIVPNKTFDKYLFVDNGGDFKTARNAVGGMINKGQGSEHFKRVRIPMFRILGGELAKKPISQQFKKMEELGFEVPKYRVVKTISSESLSKYYATRTSKSIFELDGIVVERNVVNPVVGGRPKYAKAFKENLEEDMVQTKIKDIIWQDTRTGILSPVGIIEPTLIGGVTVSRVSLHNLYTVKHGYRYKDRNLGLPVRPIGRGSIVKMVRSGKVIPHMVEVIKAAKKPLLPENFEEHGRHAYTTQTTQASETRAITHFFSTLKVEGLKQGTVTKLIADGFDSVPKIVNMRGVDWRRSSVGESNAIKLPSEIKRKLASADVVTLAHASNIFKGVGTTRFETVFDSIPDILNKAARAKSIRPIQAEIESLPNMGKVMSGKIAQNLKEFVLFLKEIKVKPQAQKKVKVTGNKLAGHTILMTGVRDDTLKQWIIQQGGKVAGSMTKAVTILIVKDSSFTSSKVDTAEERGIPIVPKDAFQKFVEKL